jgi:predicted outer membrane repeat protein
MRDRCLRWFFPMLLVIALLVGLVSSSNTSASANSSFSVEATGEIGEGMVAAPLTLDSPGLPRTVTPFPGSPVASQLPDRPAAIITVTNNSDSGAGSLRQAIIDAIAGDVINFSSSLAGQVIVLTSGQLDINKNLTIDASLLAARISISGNNTQRVFNIINNSTVTMISLGVINGYASDGAGVVVPSGSTLNLNNCLFSGNVASNFGGGVYNTGTLSITNCRFANNQASWGGGLENRQALSVIDTTFTTNSATSGGAGAETYGGSVTIARSAFINNISSNGSTVGSGGGFQTDPGTGNVWLTNVTFSGNRASGTTDDGGGAIMSYGGTLYLSHLTLANNYSATHGGGISTSSGYATTINFNNTILYANTAATGSLDDLYGTFNSQDYNLIGTLSGATLTGATSHNLIGQNPELNTLSDNGGSSYSFALLPGSPAIDYIPASVNGCGSTLYEEQRGRTRPVNYPDYPGGCDIGAFELQKPETFTTTLGDGATQTFGATLTSITDNVGGVAPGSTTINRIPITSTLLTQWDMPFRIVITATVQSGLNFNLSLCYTSWELNNNPSITPSQLELYHWNGNSWDRIGADNRFSDPLTGVTCVTKNNVNNLGRWALIDTSVPTVVSLENFTVKVKNYHQVSVIWFAVITATCTLVLVSLRLWKHKPRHNN